MHVYLIDQKKSTKYDIASNGCSKNLEFLSFLIVFSVGTSTIDVPSLKDRLSML